MRRWWLEIALKSDMCAATGESEKGLVDIKTAAEYGIPLIPGKRMKGCLLNEGKEMVSNGFIKKETLDHLFGCAGMGNPGSLIVKDAHLYKVPGSIFCYSEKEPDVIVEDYEQVFTELRGDSRLKARQIETILTRERTRTAIDRELGTALDQTLRTMQVVPRGIVFRSLLELRYPEQEEEVQLLEYCVKALRHIGLGTTRGFGEVACTLREVTPEDNPANARKDLCLHPGRQTELQYEIVLKSPVLFAGENGMAEDCREQVPGASIMGALAAMMIEDHNLGNRAHEDETFRRIFLRDGVQFGDGFLKRGKNVFYPCPANLARKKDGQSESQGQVINLFLKENECVRRKNINNQISFGKNKIFLAETEKEIRMHHARPADRGIGHALNDRFEAGASDMGQLFEYTALSKGQHFCGTLKGSSEDLAMLIRCLEKRKYRFYLGRSRTAEYGEVEMRCFTEQKAEGEMRSKTWLLWLISPLAAVDWTSGNIGPQPELLIEQMQEKLGCKVVMKECMLKYTRVGGYNSKWRLPMPQYEAMAPGSVLVVEAERELCSSELEDFRWGTATGRGYGQVKALSESLLTDRMENDLLIEAEEDKEIDAGENPLFRALLDCQEKKEKINREAYEAFVKCSSLPNMTLITKLIRLAEDGGVGSYNEIKDIIEQISDQDKRNAAKAFMKPCENLSMEAVKIYLDKCKWKARKEGR